MLALAIALVIRTVKQYTRSLLSTTVGDSSVGDSPVGVLCTVARTSSTVEVRAAGLLPVAVGVRWDSLLVVTYCSLLSRQ
jgi:hypothetical protein